MISIERMSPKELKSTLVLAMIFALRMLGLFMVLPVLALYAEKMPYATPLLIGLAAGIYGFTQALLQLPYGILSDYLGRKPVIIGGLILFAIGSLVAAFSTSIWGLIIGRAIQGAGAIGSPILALVSDVTRAEVRTRAMALIGISIGATFTLAILLGPLVDAYWGLFGIFAITAGLAIAAVGSVLFLKTQAPMETVPHFISPLKDIAKRGDLWSLNISIFALHALLIACFQVLPVQIETIIGVQGADVWKFYLPVLGISLLLIAPLLRRVDNPLRQKKLMKIAMVLSGLSVLAFATTNNENSFIISVILFFMVFNFLEASLPALLSQAAPQASRGTAFGMYSCAQFLGMFCGGVLGGYVLQTFEAFGIGLLCISFGIIGFLTLKGKNDG